MDRSAMTWKTILCLVVFLAGMGWANAQGTSDLIGIYTADDGTGANYMDANLYQPYTVYLCVENASEVSGIIAWECNIETTSGLMVLAWDLTWGKYATSGPLNIGTPPDFIVGVGKTPLENSDCINLMSITYMVTDPSPQYFWIHPSPVPSLPDHPVYIPNHNIGLLKPLYWESGDEIHPAFAVNTEALELSTDAVSVAAGAEVDFYLRAGTDEPDRDYIILGSLSGTAPGVPLNPWVTLPLNWDFFSNVVLSYTNSPALLNFKKTLDDTGEAWAHMSTMGPMPPSAVGFDMYFAYVLYNPVSYVSNPRSFHVDP